MSRTQISPDYWRRKQVSTDYLDMEYVGNRVYIAYPKPGYPDGGHKFLTLDGTEQIFYLGIVPDNFRLVG